MADYHGLWIMMDYHVLMGLIMDYGLSWTIEDYCGTSRIYYGFSWILKYDHHGIAWITRYTPQASDDTWKTCRRYGAYRSLHRSCAILFLLWLIVDYYGVSSLMDYHGWSWISVDDHGLSRIIMGRSRITDYRWLTWIIVDYGLSWIILDYRAWFWNIMTIMGYHGLSWVIMDYYGLSWNMDYRWLSWIMDDPALSQMIVNYCGLLWLL